MPSAPPCWRLPAVPLTYMLHLLHFFLLHRLVPAPPFALVLTLRSVLSHPAEKKTHELHCVTTALAPNFSLLDLILNFTPAHLAVKHNSAVIRHCYRVQRGNRDEKLQMRAPHQAATGHFYHH